MDFIDLLDEGEINYLMNDYNSLSELIIHTHPIKIYINKKHLAQLISEEFKFNKCKRLKSVYINIDPDIVSSKLTNLDIKPISKAVEVNNLDIISDLIFGELFVSISLIEINNDIISLFKNTYIGTLLIYNCDIKKQFKTLIDTTISVMVPNFVPPKQSRNNILIKRKPSYKEEVEETTGRVIYYDITKPKTQSLIHKKEDKQKDSALIKVVHQLSLELYSIKRKRWLPNDINKDITGDIIIKANPLKKDIDISGYINATTITIIESNNHRLILGQMPKLKSIKTENCSILCDIVELLQKLTNIANININIKDQVFEYP